MGRFVWGLALLAAGSLLADAPGFASIDAGPLAPEERDALIALYKATDGDHWTNRAGWLGPPGTECQWHGVFCVPAENGRWSVFDLGLFDNHLAGEIPPAIGQLKHLEKIDLGQNQLRGGVPDAMAEMKHLKSLVLLRNALSGMLPDSLIRRWEEGSLDIVADVAQITDVSQIEFDWIANSVLCARRRITLRADGSAVLLSERCREATPDDRATFCEKKEGTLHWTRFAKLARLVAKNGFYALQPSYSTSVTHGRFETTRVTRNGKTYSVENYADGGPIELWTIQRAIEGVAFGIDWARTTTLPECPAFEYAE